jgi:hypothetical protein
MGVPCDVVQYMMKKVVSHQRSTETKGTIKNGKIERMDLYAIWVLQLECGHREKRRDDSPAPPAKVKCRSCSKLSASL